jgi:hypothetical protein
MGTSQWRPSTVAGGVPHVGVGAAKTRSAVSALRGWSIEPHKSVKIRWNSIGVVCAGLVTTL